MYDNHEQVIITSTGTQTRKPLTAGGGVLITGSVDRGILVAMRANCPVGIQSGVYQKGVLTWPD